MEELCTKEAQRNSIRRRYCGAYALLNIQSFRFKSNSRTRDMSCSRGPPAWKSEGPDLRMSGFDSAINMPLKPKP